MTEVPVRYEYKVMIASDYPGKDVLEQLGEEGWQLIQIVPYAAVTPDNRVGHLLYLQRVMLS